MKVEIKDGKLSISMQDLFGEASQVERAWLVQSLACHTEVIDEVMSQVIDGYTSEGLHGFTSFGGNALALHGIDGARMRIATASSEIAAREIARLAEALAMSEKHSRDGWDAYHSRRSGG